MNNFIEIEIFQHVTCNIQQTKLGGAFSPRDNTLRVDLGARRVHVGRLEEAPGDAGRPLYLPHPVGAAGPGQHTVAVPVARLVAPVTPALSKSGVMICLPIRKVPRCSVF